MFFSRGLVGYLLLFLLSISALYDGRVLGARNLREKLEDDVEKSETLEENSKNNNGDEGFFATINRQVPSCPDPLHNR
ncbi:hypothetical protein SLE2022_082410 [Rubroshorea leprosula]|uniref:Uncharacterized protein n=1 Tax=Rubroshorea leprosula TaxID=152421 RepID=A0AAV5K163_9ROSI|nr:hypothetical protein SLEP1_g30753 [Rubroshorea leprosula]